MILLIDAARNQHAFEDVLATALVDTWRGRGFDVERARVAQPDDYDNVRIAIEQKKPEFICVLAHGAADPTELDVIDAFNFPGVWNDRRKKLVNSYYLLEQLLGNPQHDFYLLLAVCEGYCTDSIAAFSVLTNLKGIIASREKVHALPLLGFVQQAFANLSAKSANAPPEPGGRRSCGEQDRAVWATVH